MPKDTTRKIVTGQNDLLTLFPALSQQAYGWDPSTVTPGMGRKLPWKCSQGHIWDARIQNRVRGIGCPVCSNQLIIAGVNSLDFLYPELAAQSDGWDPSKYGAGSAKKQKWKCAAGHSYILRINQRVSGIGCQVCAGRQVSTGFNDLLSREPEIAFEADGWDPSNEYFQTSSRKSWKCKRGHKWNASIINRVRLKTGCPSCSGRLVIPGQTDLLTNNPEIADEAYNWDPRQISTSSSRMLEWKCKYGHIYEATPNSRTRTDNRRGCPYCSGRKILIGFNDLATTHPLIAEYAYGWNPQNYSMGQTKKLDWKCRKGHLWSQSPNHVVKHKYTCPTCSAETDKYHGRTLFEVFPQLSAQAYGWDPSAIGIGSAKILSWQCSLGHIWKASLTQRTSKGSGCPHCAGQKVWPGFNDLATKFPLIAQQADGWNPSEVLAGGTKHRRWKCADGHTWEVGIASRLRGTGCPSCAIYGFDPNKEAVLYLMKHDEWGLFQIGITNSPEHRIRLHKQRGWELIDVWGPTDGLLVKGWERSILTYLRSNGALMAPEMEKMNFDGYTEAWSQKSFLIQNLKILMEMARNI